MIGYYTGVSKIGGAGTAAVAVGAVAAGGTILLGEYGNVEIAKHPYAPAISFLATAGLYTLAHWFLKHEDTDYQVAKSELTRALRKNPRLISKFDAGGDLETYINDEVERLLAA